MVIAQQSLGTRIGLFSELNEFFDEAWSRGSAHLRGAV
jgi:hypothetical protein